MGVELVEAVRVEGGAHPEPGGRFGVGVANVEVTGGDRRVHPEPAGGLDVGQELDGAHRGHDWT